MADGTNTASITAAQSGRSLLQVFGDANKWGFSERNPPMTLADSLDREQALVQDSIRAYQQERDNHQLWRSTYQKAYTYSHWTSGFPSVNPATSFQGDDYGTNPFSRNRVDWMRW